MINFDNASTSFPKAPGVGEAMLSYISSAGFNINRGVYESACAIGDTVIDTREMLCRFFDGPDPKNVIFTPGITFSINCILAGFLKPGDHVITTSMDHNAVLRPLHRLSQMGVEVSHAVADRDGTLPLCRITELKRPNTKLLIMICASNVCGVLTPFAEAGLWASSNGIRFVVDTAQLAGVLPISMRDIHADAVAFAGHKGLLGPQGIGGMIIADSFSETIEPLVAGGTGSISDKEDLPHFLPDRFESGTMNLPGIVGLNVSLRYLEQVGISGIYAHEMGLTERFIDGVKRLKGVRLVGIPDTKGRVAVVSLDFSATGLDNSEVSYRLDAEHSIMTRCGMHCAPRAHKTLGTFPNGTVRFSFGYSNTGEEVDTCIRVLTEMING